MKFFTKLISVASGPRVVVSFDQPTAEHPPQVIYDLGSFLTASISHSAHPLPVRPTESEQQKFLIRYSSLLQQWADTNFSRLQQIGRPHVVPPQNGEAYHRNLLWCKPGLFSIYLHVWAPGRETPPHTHGKQIGLIIPVDPGMQEQKWETAGPSWIEDGESYIHLKHSVESDCFLAAGRIFALTRDTGFLHVARNGSLGPCRVLEVYIRDLKKIRLFEYAQSPDIFKITTHRKIYVPWSTPVPSPASVH